VRVCLLIDVELDTDQTMILSEQATEQPVVLVGLPVPLGETGGRLVGARHVEGAPAAQVHA
jgi:hypothetical protein